MGTSDAMAASYKDVMLRHVSVLLVIVLACCSRPQPKAVVLSVCDLSRDFTAYRGKLVAVRGVFYYGLRQKCPQTCATGPWASFLDLAGSDDAETGNPPAGFVSDQESWVTLDKALRTVEHDAKQGKRLEIWVTAVGRVRASDHRSPVGPCDIVARGHYGHLGGAPAQLVVKRFTDIEVVPNPNSPYDYSNMYRGAW
jgi:hypothetical protein